MIDRDDNSNIGLSTMIPAAGCLVLSGCRKKSSGQADAGSFSGRRYSNAFFGLTVTVPADWYLPSAQSLAQLMDSGARLSVETSQTDTKRTGDDGSEDLALFSIFRYRPDTAQASNPGIIAVSESIRPDAGIKNSRDYLKQLCDTLADGSLQWTETQTMGSETLDGVAFSVIKGQIADKTDFVNQSWYVTLRKDYALCFVLSYTNPQEEGLLVDILRTIKFEPV